MNTRKKKKSGSSGPNRVRTPHRHHGSQGREVVPGRSTEGTRPSEKRIDESVEESFPASDPPAHRLDPSPGDS